MPEWTQPDLARSVLATLQNVLVHQRPRWATLVGHQHQMEGWWKAEFLLALESWCWRADLPEETWVRPEAKPRDYGIGSRRESVDLLVARWGGSAEKMGRKPPRIWVEMKERGTWWGNPGKALGGLQDDLSKWQGAAWLPGDIVVAGQILLHDAKPPAHRAVPENWASALEEVTQSFPRFLPTRSVGYPCYSPERDGLVYRYATIDFFTVHGVEFIPPT